MQTYKIINDKGWLLAYNKKRKVDWLQISGIKEQMQDVLQTKSMMIIFLTYIQDYNLIADI